jgi:hypothetical protein
MKSWVDTAAAALISGTAASLAMTAALALLAKKEGKGALQPINSTSHWLHGEQASSVRSLDVSHTGLGFGTHHVSALFWALIFESWLATRPGRTRLLLLRDATAMSAIAARVDYGITPKRFTPGWEEVLSKRSIIGVTYAAMALGLTAGAMLSSRIAPATFCQSIKARTGGAMHERSRAEPTAAYLRWFHFFVPRLVAAFAPDLSIRKSSLLFPLLTASFIQPGVAPRPAHVSPSGPRYFAATFVPFKLLPRPPLAPLPDEPTEPPSEANCCSSVER